MSCATWIVPNNSIKRFRSQFPLWGFTNNTNFLKKWPWACLGYVELRCGCKLSALLRMCATLTIKTIAMPRIFYNQFYSWGLSFAHSIMSHSSMMTYRHMNFCAWKLTARLTCGFMSMAMWVTTYTITGWVFAQMMAVTTPLQRHRFRGRRGRLSAVVRVISPVCGSVPDQVRGVNKVTDWGGCGAAKETKLVGLMMN